MLSFEPSPAETAPNDDSFRMRLPHAVKERVQAAATALGLDTLTFVRQTIAREAEAVHAAQTSYHMTQADLGAFAAAKDSPPADLPRDFSSTSDQSPPQGRDGR